MAAAYILEAVRTPGGKAKKGALKDARPDDLAALVLKAVLARARRRAGGGGGRHPRLRLPGGGGRA